MVIQAISAVTAWLLPFIDQLLSCLDWINFILVSTLAVSITVLARSFSFRSKIPPPFEVYRRTSFPLPPEQIDIKTSDALELFKKEYGPRMIVHIENWAIHCGTFYRAMVLKALESNKIPNLDIGRMPLPIDLDLKGVAKEKFGPLESGRHKNIYLEAPHLNRITFSSSSKEDHSGPIIIRNARIQEIVISAGYNGHIILEDCWIGSITFHPADSPPRTNFSLIRSWVASLNLHENSCASLSIRTGGILQLQCPAPSYKSPITRSFFVADTTVLYDKSTPASISEISQYKNLSHHIKACTDPLTQQLVAAKVFELERNSEKGFLKFINYCYFIFSGYNTKPGLPLLWMITTFTLFVCVTYNFDMAVLSRDCTISAVTSKSWIGDMCSQSNAGTFTRSLGLVFNSFVSPFSSLAENTLLKTTSLYFHLLTLIAGMLNLIWIALAAFSVRTRFTGKTNS